MSDTASANTQDKVEMEARMAAYTATNPEHLAGMVKGASDKVLEILAANPDTPAAALDLIARKAKITSQALPNLGENKNTSSETLERIHKKAEGSLFRKNIARFLTDSINSYHEVRVLASMGGNEATPVDILRKFAVSKWPSVRYSIVSNPKLGVSERVEVLCWCLEHDKGADAPVSSGMMLDALDHKDLPESIRSKNMAEIINRFTGLHGDMAKMKHLDLATVKVLNNSNQPAVKENLYSNPHLPEQAYKVLSQTNDFHLLQVFAENPSVPEKMIRDLVKDTLDAFAEIERLKEYKNLALAISKNPFTPLDSLTDLTQGSEGHVPDSILKALFQAVEDKTKQA